MKILIGTPICESKLYSIDEYMESISVLKTDVMIVQTDKVPSMKTFCKKTN